MQRRVPPRHPVPSLAADANASDAAEADAGICACKAADCDAASALSNMRTKAPSPPTQVNATSMFNEVDEDGDDCVTRAQWLAKGVGTGTVVASRSSLAHSLAPSAVPPRACTTPMACPTGLAYCASTRMPVLQLSLCCFGERGDSESGSRATGARGCAKAALSFGLPSTQVARVHRVLEECRRQWLRTR